MLLILIYLSTYLSRDQNSRTKPHLWCYDLDWNDRNETAVGRLYEREL
jgi:hypothetical protein